MFASSLFALITAWSTYLSSFTTLFSFATMTTTITTTTTQEQNNSPPFVLAFGNSSLTQRLLLEEILLVGGGLLFPMSLVIGLWSIRIAALYNPAPRYIRYDVWNLMVRFIVADIILEWLLLPRFQCVMMLPNTTTTTISTSITSNTDESLLSSSLSSSSYAYYSWEWALQSFGYGGCQRTTASFVWDDYVNQQASSTSPSMSEHSVFIGTPTALGIMFAIRLTWICLGVYLGEGFFPICLTGGIACGKSTVAQYLVHPELSLSSSSSNDDTDNNKESTFSTTTTTTPDRHYKKSDSTSSSQQPSSDHNNSTNTSKPQRRKSNPNSQHHSHASPSSSSSSPVSTKSIARSKKHHKKNTVVTATEEAEPSSSEQAAAAVHSNSNILLDGSVYLVDTDSIAHEILLPPGDPGSTIDPAMSVYDQILQAFDQYDILEQEEEEEEESSADNNNEHAMAMIPSMTTLRDTDRPSSALQQQQQSFGTRLHGHGRHHRRRIDRRKLGAVVFADHAKRRMLNQLTHPRIRVVMVQRLLYGLYRSGKDFCIADVPLLFESGGPLRWIFGLVVLVTCRGTPGLQLQRLMARNADLSLEQCQQRIASQMPLDQKEQMSHIVLDNSYDRSDLAAAVERARDEMMMRIHGVGISLCQMVLILGGSVPVAVLSKMYTTAAAAAADSSSHHLGNQS